MRRNKLLGVIYLLYCLAIIGLSLADYFLMLGIRKFFGSAAFVILALYFFSKVSLSYTMNSMPVKFAQEQAKEQSKYDWISLKGFLLTILPLALAYFSCFL
ncbi:hypothetical protein [Holdemania massiliensis]|uniref:hypothetical protein n=1 Tax=Holdemania massiliensis TaxID=1468449 RepID=UPI00356951FA